MILSLLFVLVALIYLIYTYRRYVQYPPGPIPLPIFGHLLHLFITISRGQTAAGALLSWKKNYGRVFTIWLGPFPLVCVCDYKLIVEEFTKKGDLHSGRYPGYLLELLREGNHGIVFADGPLWQEQRRFALQVLRDFGMGRNLMEQRILEEVQSRIVDLDQELSNSKGKLTIDPKAMLDLMVGSVINAILFGFRFEEAETNEFQDVKRLMDDQIEMLSISDIVIFNPWTRRLPFLKQRAERLTSNLNGIYNFLQKNIDEHKKRFDYDEEADDYTFVYLKEMERRKRAGENMGYFSEKQLKIALFDLWLAGMETTITTLQWAFLYMIIHPEVQEKCRKEIFSHLDGDSRPIVLKDRSSLPYTNATITEIHRCGNIINFNLLHKTTADTVIDGYSIPAGTITAPQLSVIMKDDENFVDAVRFDPTRFLDSELGAKLEQRVIPFGIGKRVCPGEGMARAEVFLMFTNMLKQFRFSAPIDQPPPVLQTLNEGIFRQAKSYQCEITAVN